MSKTVLVSVGAVLFAATFAAAAFVATLPGVLTRGPGFCDTAVPVWYPSHLACTETPALVEHLWPPERWGAPTYCTGMCLDIDMGPQLQAEWIRSHGRDSLAE